MNKPQRPPRQILSWSAAIAMVAYCAAPASAQIISSMIPVATPMASTGPGATPAERSVLSAHIMVGFTNWDFGFFDVSPDLFTTHGGRNGYIVAGDTAVRVGSGAMTLGAGGWFNKVSDYVLNSGSPYYIETAHSRSLGSLYGNFFYRHIGVQAGVIRMRGGVQILTRPQNDDIENDADLFAVGRFSQQRWSATAGAGLYVYGARAADTLIPDVVRATPSTRALTFFGNGSLKFSHGFTLDLSYWYVGTDTNYFGVGSGNQSRFTIGVGYGR